jgi:ABC-type multidrug transport system ATPase subunit
VTLQGTTRVIELMEIVGLVPLADVRTSKLTGGQLKLLSVAMGLVQAPTVLFLDEPTTGLDSTSASAVMECVPPPPPPTHHYSTHTHTHTHSPLP